MGSIDLAVDTSNDVAFPAGEPAAGVGDIATQVSTARSMKLTNRGPVARLAGSLGWASCSSVWYPGRSVLVVGSASRSNKSKVKTLGWPLRYSSEVSQSARARASSGRRLSRGRHFAFRT